MYLVYSEIFQHSQNKINRYDEPNQKEPMKMRKPRFNYSNDVKDSIYLTTL